jgi:hypothetical protein
VASVVLDQKSLGLSPVLVTEIRVGSSPGVAGAHRPGQQYPKGAARRIGRDVRTSVLHRSESLKPGAPIASLSLFGNPEKAIHIIQPNRKTPPRSIFEADGTDLGTLEGALSVPSNTCAGS